MATTIYFNGRVTAIPGSYSEVDTSGLASIGLGASGIVACIGEAEGSQPAIVQNVTNPGKVSKLFRAGDLREAGNILFDPSKDAGIPGGAQEVKFVKVNPATVSTATFADADGTNSLVVSSKDYGAFNNKISIAIANGTNSGKAVTVVYEDQTETFDDVGGDGIAKLTYANADVDAATVEWTDVAGLTAKWSDVAAGKRSDYVGSFDNAGADGDVNAGAAFWGPVEKTISIKSTAAGDTAKAVTVYGIKAGGAPRSEVITTNGADGTVFTNSVHNDWLGIAGAVFVAHAGTITVHDAGGGGGNSVLSATTATTTLGLRYFSDPLEISGGGDDAGKISVVANGATTSVLMVIGTAGGAPTVEAITLAGAVAQTGATNNWSSINAIGLLMVAAGRTITHSGLFLETGTAVKVTSSAAGDVAQVVTLYGLDAAGAVASSAKTLSGVADVTFDGTWSKVFGVKLSAAADGTVTVSSVSNAVTVFTLAPGTTSKGLQTYTTPVKIDTQKVNIAAAAAKGEVLLIGTTGAGAAQLSKRDLAAVPDALTAETWGSVEAIAVGHTDDAVTLSGTAFNLAPATYKTPQDWASFLTPYAEWTQANITPAPKTYTLTRLDNVSAQDAKAGYAFLAGLDGIVTTLNAGSNLVTAAEHADGVKAPANTAAPVMLAGGIEGVTLFSHWQAALDLLRDYRVNTIVVLTTDAAVHAAVLAHCAYMCGAGRSERDCFLGAPSGTTLTNAKAQALALNSRHARYFIQDVQRFNTSGVKEQFAPPFTACVAAGMQAGSGVGISLTFKYLNIVESFGHDATYTLQDNAHELIESGICAVEKVPNVGFRWLRNVTSHLIDDNLAYVEGSVNEAVNYAVFNYRTALEAHIGEPGFAGTVNAVVATSVSILNQLVQAGSLSSWRSLTVELDSDVMTVDVEIAPIIPVNFIKTTVHLVSSSFSAAA